MKITYFVLLIYIISIASNINTSKIQVKLQEDQKIAFNETESKLISQTLIELNCAAKPLKTTCPNCLKPTNGNQFMHFYLLKRHRKYDYKFLIQFNDDKQQVLIYLSGPVFKKENYKYFEKYYRNTIPTEKVEDFELNVELSHIYKKYIQKKLFESLDKLVKSKRDGFNLVFSGSSVGASLAIYSAYDVVKNYKNKNYKNKIQIYAFNSLVAGNEKYEIALKESSITIHRIYKEDDFMIYPGCKFDHIKQKWVCKERKVKFILAKVLKEKKADRKASKASGKPVQKKKNDKKKKKKSKSKSKELKKNEKKASRKTQNKNEKKKEKKSADKKKTKMNKKKNKKEKKVKTQDKKKLEKKSVKDDKKKDNSSKRKETQKKNKKDKKSKKNAKKKATGKNAKDGKKNNKKDKKKASSKKLKNKKVNKKVKKAKRIVIVINDETGKKQDMKKSGFGAAPVSKAALKSIPFKTGIFGEIILYDGDMSNYKICKMTADKSGKITECIINITPARIVTVYSHLILYKKKIGVCK